MKKPKKLYVLILCEESQAECKAFREKGFIAYSCDIVRCSGGHPEWHAQCPAEFFLQGGKRFYTQDNVYHYVPRWDLIIAHPPCTYLCKVSSVHMWTKGEINPLRYAHMKVAADFFRQCLRAPAPFVAVENPIPMQRAGLPDPDCFVEPYWFGDPYSKKTLYWLKDLPPIMPEVDMQEVKQFVHSSRGKYRSRTFQGIARALAKQWGDYVKEKALNQPKKTQATT